MIYEELKRFRFYFQVVGEDEFPVKAAGCFALPIGNGRNVRMGKAG
jgi:hypothetical protein